MIIISRERYRRLIKNHEYKGDFNNSSGNKCYVCKHTLRLGSKIGVIEHKEKNYQRILCGECLRIFENERNLQESKNRQE